MAPSKTQNPDRPVTKNEVEELLTANTDELKKTFATKTDLDTALAVTKGDFEQLLADQATVILEAVDEKLDKRFGDVMTGIDKVLKEVQAHREEDVAGAEQLRRHDDQLQNHERQIKSLELRPQQ